jgi:ElaA protein
MTTNYQWFNKKFNQLTTNQLYDILKLRVDVFVVEQCCYYPELDNLDRDNQTQHIFCYQGDNIAAYLRVLAKGVSYQEYASLGRVAVAKKARGANLGHLLIEKGLEHCLQQWPSQAIKISAQQHLEAFYQQHGFKTVSAMYLEDNIPHIAMLKAAE